MSQKQNKTAHNHTKHTNHITNTKIATKTTPEIKAKWTAKPNKDNSNRLLCESKQKLPFELPESQFGSFVNTDQICNHNS